MADREKWVIHERLWNRLLEAGVPIEVLERDFVIDQPIPAVPYSTQETKPDDVFTVEMLDEAVRQAQLAGHTNFRFICSRCGAFTNEVLHHCGGAYG